MVVTVTSFPASFRAVTSYATEGTVGGQPAMPANSGTDGRLTHLDAMLRYDQEPAAGVGLFNIYHN